MVLMDTVKKWLGAAKEQAGDFSEKAKPMVEKTQGGCGRGVGQVQGRGR